MVTHPQCVKYLSAGRVILLKTGEEAALAVTLSTTSRGSRTYKCLGELGNRMGA